MPRENVEVQRDSVQQEKSFHSNTNDSPAEVFASIWKAWKILCVVTVTAALILLFLVGGEFTYRLNWQQAIQAIKLIFK